MPTDFKYISGIKKTDAIVQILAFVGGLLYCCVEPQNSIYAVLFFAAIQSLSAIAWTLFFTGKAPRMRRGTVIRQTFILILIISGLVVLIDLTGIVIIGIIMLIGGPICGILYFSATLAEISFYNSDDTSRQINDQ